MSKVRINDLAREMEVKSRQVLDILAELGLAAGKTHSSSLEDYEADKVRAHFKRGSRPASQAGTPASRAPQAITPKIDLSHISKPGDVLKAVLAKKQEEEAEARQSRLPLRRTAAAPAPEPAPPTPPAAVVAKPPAGARQTGTAQDRSPAPYRAAHRRPASCAARHCHPPACQSCGRQGAPCRRNRAASGLRRGAARGGRCGQAPGQTAGCSS